MAEWPVELCGKAQRVRELELKNVGIHSVIITITSSFDQLAIYLSIKIEMLSVSEMCGLVTSLHPVGLTSL